MKSPAKIYKIMLVSGTARSGTSLLGKIIGSCKKIEYLYEPETFNYLSYISDKVKKDIWINLIERHLVENFLNLINGRTYNFRKNENSSINDMKLMKEIKHKFSKEVSTLDFDNYVKRNQISFLIKSPNLQLNKIAKNFPNFKMIIIKRNPFQVINSLINKKWFKGKNYLKTFLPSVKIKGKFYPIWMRNKYINLWHNSNEYTKCAIYLSCTNEQIKEIKKKIVVDYDELIEKPKSTINILLKRLNLKKTKKTHQIIKNIKLSKTAKNINMSYFKKKISQDLLKSIQNI